MKIFLVYLLCACFLVEVSSTAVQSCEGTGLPHEHAADISIQNCEKPPCKLKRKTQVSLEMKFKMEEDTELLRNNVHAKIVGIPFPFLGVDGTSACDQIYLTDGTKAGCPLKAGQDYVFKNKIDVLEIYPKLRMVVQWGLTNPGGKDVICFKVPAKITS